MNDRHSNAPDAVTHAATAGDGEHSITPASRTVEKPALGAARSSRILVVLVLIATAALGGYGVGRGQGPSPVPSMPVFVPMDRAFGENADDEPLRSCMTRKTRELMTRAGAAATDGIDYAALLEYLKSSNERDLTWDSGILGRGTIPLGILQACRAGLPGNSLAVGDLDGDLLPEVAFNRDGRVQLWWNKGLGQFMLQQLEPVPGAAAMQVTFVDVDGDAHPDIVTLNPEREQFTTYYNSTTDPFTERVLQEREVFQSVGGDAAWSMTSADLDKDGLADLVVANRGFGQQIRDAVADGRVVKPIRIFYNTGDRAAPWREQTLEAVHLLDVRSPNTSRGAVSEVVEQKTERSQISGAYYATVADFNNDSWPDIYVASDYLAPRLFFAEKGGRSFVDASNKSKMFEDMPNTMSATAVDYDQDGWLDILATDTDVRLGECFGFRACGGFGGHKLLRNNHDGTFSDVAAKAGLADAGWGFGFTINDLNMDGYADFTVATGDLTRGRLETHWLTTFQKPFLLVGGPAGYSDESLAMLRALRSPSMTWQVASADFDGDMRPDLIFNGPENRAPYLLLNRGAGTTSTLLVQGRGKGGSPTGAEGAIVTVEQKGRPRQTYHLNDNMSNFLVQTTATPLPIGLAENDSAVVTVRFPSGATVTATIRAGQSHRIIEPGR